MKLFALVAPVLFSSLAMASIAYDANLVAPGWYNGTGNPNGGFTVATANGVELGLRAKMRQSPNVIDSPTDLYLVQAGPEPGVPARAWWNWEFSIDLQGTGLTLADVTASLKVTDLTTNANGMIGNLFTHYADNSGFGSGGKVQPAVAGDFGFQNSENPIFADFPVPGYNENSLDTYQFDLTLTRKSDSAVLGTDTILVQVAPEPGAIALVGCGLAGLLFLGRRFRHIQKDVL